MSVIAKFLKLSAFHVRIRFLNLDFALFTSGQRGFDFGFGVAGFRVTEQRRGGQTTVHGVQARQHLL